MVPKKPLKDSGLAVGSVVEVSFRLLPQDEVGLPQELSDMLALQRKAHAAWSGLSPGKQRALAHLVGRAKRAETRCTRVEKVRLILLGEAPLPWAMASERTRQQLAVKGRLHEFGVTPSL